MDILLWYYTKTHQVVGLLNVSCNVKSETIWMKFLYSIKIHWLSCTLNRSFIHAWLCNIMHWSFGNYWFNELGRVSKFDTFHLYNTKIITIINITTNFIRKALNLRELSNSRWQIQIFQNSTSIKIWNFVIGNKYDQLFSLK